MNPNNHLPIFAALRAFVLVVVGVVVVLPGCKPRNTPKPPVIRPSEYTSCYHESYGRFYDSVPLNVFALDLYSEGLSLDSTQHIVGTGWNLYLSDIFSSEKSLPAGDYRSSKEPTDYTFLPGMEFEGMPHGAYLLYIVSDKITDIVVLEEGAFSLSQSGDTTDISLYFTHKQDTIYRAHYRGVMTKKGK